MDKETDKFKLLVEIFDNINYKIKDYDDLDNIVLDHIFLKNTYIINKLYQLIPKLKKKYDSHTLTCLHLNSLDKQKFPAINMVRQILKRNGYKMTPYTICKGYDTTGRKRIERYYRVNKNDSNNTNLNKIASIFVKKIFSKLNIKLPLN